MWWSIHKSCWPQNYLSAPLWPHHSPQVSLSTQAQANSTGTKGLPPPLPSQAIYLFTISLLSYPTCCNQPLHQLNNEQNSLLALMLLAGAIQSCWRVALICWPYTSPRYCSSIRKVNFSRATQWSQEFYKSTFPVQGLGMPTRGTEAKEAGIDTDERYSFTSLCAMHKFSTGQIDILYVVHIPLVNSGSSCDFF